MANVQTISSSHVPVWEKDSILSTLNDGTSGKYRLYTRDAVIRIRRPVSTVWEAWTSRSFWKCFFAYEDFEGEFCPASEFFARGTRNGQSFQEHGEFSVVQEGLVLRYHVWHWGKNAEHDGDSSVTVTFKSLEDGSMKILVIQSWKLLVGESDPSFDWNVRLESIRLFLENICA